MFPQTLDYIKALLKANQSTGSLCKRTPHWNTSSTQLFSSVQFLYPGVVYPLQDLVVPFYLSWPRLKKTEEDSSPKSWGYSLSLHVLPNKNDLSVLFSLLKRTAMAGSLRIMSIFGSTFGPFGGLRNTAESFGSLSKQGKGKRGFLKERERDAGRVFLPHSQTLYPSRPSRITLKSVWTRSHVS